MVHTSLVVVWLEVPLAVVTSELLLDVALVLGSLELLDLLYDLLLVCGGLG